MEYVGVGSRVAFSVDSLPYCVESGSLNFEPSVGLGYTYSLATQTSWLEERREGK